MATSDRTSQTQPSERERDTVYFEMLAETGFTKHMGGMASTEELIEKCHIDGGKCVLEVGCGVGMTPVYLAKTFGCRVIGVDVTPGMIRESQARAAREGVQGLVQFQLGDARDLPFEDDLFDVVMCESLIAFVPDKQKAVNEMVRVAKAGGHVGLNESTWVKQPSQRMLGYFSRALGGNMEPQTVEGWEQLLTTAGLKEVTARGQALTYRGEAVNRLRRLGWSEMGRVLGKFFAVAIAKPEYRHFMRDVLSDPRGIIDYLGYGVYVGRK